MGPWISLHHHKRNKAPTSDCGTECFNHVTSSGYPPREKSFPDNMIFNRNNQQDSISLTITKKTSWDHHKIHTGSPLPFLFFSVLLTNTSTTVNLVLQKPNLSYDDINDLHVSCCSKQRVARCTSQIKNQAKIQSIQHIADHDVSKEWGELISQRTRDLCNPLMKGDAYPAPRGLKPVLKTEILRAVF